MKKTTIRCTFIAISLIVIFTSRFVSAKSMEPTNLQFDALVLEVQANKKSYILGEPVGLKFKVTNRSSAPMVLHGGADVWHGLLGVLIAYGDDEFKRYLGPRWGLTDSIGKSSIPLAPGDLFETEASILYNHRVETDHLNEDAARQAAKGRIETEYALIKPGRYRIKAILYDSDLKSKIESKPIQVSVEEPQGADVEVWSTLKSNAEYAYFIQTGSPKGHPTAAKTKQMVQALEKLIDSYPASRYVESIHHSLSRYRSELEELKKRGVIKP
jgi:hypothetical protein